MMSSPPKSGLSDNAIGAIAYFTPVMAIFFLAIRRYNKRPYVRFHAWQSLVFNVFAILFGYVLTFAAPYGAFLGRRVLMGIMCAAGLVAFLMWLWCVIGALNGKRIKLPVIGEWADEQAYR
ncbi:MAG: Tic20 family protein [Terracidiphilus sp.]